MVPSHPPGAAQDPLQLEVALLGAGAPGAAGESSLPMGLSWEGAAMRSLRSLRRAGCRRALGVVVVVGGGSYFKLEQLRFGNQLG